MSDMERLAEFVLAGIADDEAAARAVNAASWRESLNLDQPGWNEFDQAEVDHIARHDPARVLAECAAKKAIVEDCVDILENPDEYTVHERDIARDHVRLLAQPYADRPGFDPAWKVET